MHVGGAEAIAEVAHRLVGEFEAVGQLVSLPPVDLWRWEMKLIDEKAIEGDVIVRPFDVTPPPTPLGYTAEVYKADRVAPITWANKPFVVWVKKK